MRTFTSMFVERMEVLEYREKFEVEQSTFFLTLLTLKCQENRFCVCVCVCLSVSAKKSVSGYLRKAFTDLDDNFGVCCNWRRIKNLP